MKKIILSLFLLVSCPMISMADYGMIKLPAEEIIKQNNTTLLQQTSTQSTTDKISVATAIPQQVQSPPSIPQPNAIMAKLTGYDLMEVVNTFAHSVSHWDTALTSGRPAFLLASDDTHNVFINTDIGRNITMIPLEPSKYELVYDTLKQGSAYGITVPHAIAMLNRDEKLKVLENHPQLLSLQVDDDGLINIKLNRQVDKITFTSDNGVEKAAFENIDNASYKFNADESYLRATAYFDNGSIAYFNPVIRTSDGLKPNMPEISLNYPLTVIKYLFSIIVAACIVYGIWYLTIKRKRN